MPQFTIHERVWLVEEYYKNKGRNGGPSVAKVQCHFQRTFTKNPPTRRNLLSMVHKFTQTGSVQIGTKKILESKGHLAETQILVECWTKFWSLQNKVSEDCHLS